MRKNSARASVVAAVSASVASGALASVIASAELSVNKTLELSSFGCGDCNTRFGAIASTKPFCITCGSEDVELLEDNTDAIPEQLDDEDQLTAVTCAVCTTHNIMRDSMVAALGGHAHCVQCGADLPYVLPEAAPAGDELPVTDPIGDADVAASSDELPDDVTEVEEIPVVEDTVEGEGVEDDVAAVGDELETDTDELDIVEVSLDELSDENDGDEFDVVQTSADTCMAFVNGMPVAKATRANVGANFATAGWTRAIKHTAAEQGRKATFAAFKFEPLLINVPLKPIVAAKVEKALATQRTAVEASAKEMSADFEQCIATALAGINKGFWRNTENALKAGFYDELTAAGVNKPTQLIDKVFASHGRSFLQTVMAKSEELRKLTLPVRNELANQVEASNYMGIADEVNEDEDEEVGQMDVTARFRGQGMRTKSVANLSAGSTLKTVLAGRKLF